MRSVSERGNRYLLNLFIQVRPSCVLGGPALCAQRIVGSLRATGTRFASNMATGGASTERIHRRISDLSTCPICLEDIRNAKALPCLHTFCLQCLKDYWNDKAAGQRVVCPVCRNPLHIPANGLESLPNNYFVQSLMEVGSHSCDGSPCEEHPGKQLELYCVKCKVAICRKCQASKHKKHDCQELGTVAEELTKSLEVATNPVRQRIDEFQAAIEQQDSNDWQFGVAAKAVDNSAKQHGEKIKNIVDVHAGELLNELREMKAGEQKEANSHRAALELAISEMRSFVDSSLELRRKGSPCDIVRKASGLRDRASQLLDTYVMAGDRGSPVVTFVPMNIDELTRDRQNLVGRVRQLSGPGKSSFTHLELYKTRC